MLLPIPPPTHAPVGGGGVGGIVIAVPVEVAVEVVQHDARLHPSPAFLGVDLQQLVHVLTEVQHQAGVDALTCQARATAPGQDGDPVLGGHLNGGLHVVGIAGNHDTDGFHLVDAGIGAVEDSREVVETYVTRDALLQLLLEFSGVGLLRYGSCSHRVPPGTRWLWGRM